MSEGEALIKTMHDERAEANTRDVDCWACEAGRSDTIKALLRRLAEAESAASHMHALLVRVVPDGDELLALWRDHWREQLAIRRARPPS